MQGSRLFKIIYYLLNKGQATASELSEKFEVSVRTIYRDIDALSEAGIPVYTEAGRSGGIRLLGDFVLDRAVLSEEEKKEVLSALSSLSVTGNYFEKAALEKLSALFQSSSEDWYEVDFSRWGEITGDKEKFEALKTAVIYHRCVEILYAGSYKAKSERVIHPLKLLYKSKEWYVKAYCTKKEDFRLFKLNRILKWRLLDEHFTPVPYSEKEDLGQQPSEEVVLRFSEKISYRVYDEFDEKQIKEQENGDLLVHFFFLPDEWLIGYLLSFGTEVEVEKPVYLKKLLAERAREIYEKNQNADIRCQVFGDITEM